MGTQYRFHPLFVLLMLLSMFTGYFMELLILFGIVFIHEMGHVAAAKSFGWNVTEVMLLPFGGVAAVDDAGGKPVLQDIAVALAGPLQNVLMAGLALWFEDRGWWTTEWTQYFVTANMMIGGFNLLPIQPLDGGRVMQALVSLWMSYHRTLMVCAWIGLASGAGVVIYSLFGTGTHIHLNLLILGLFLVYSNWYGYLHAPYFFLRYMMHRDRRASLLEEKGVIALPIVVRPTRKIAHIVKLFKRDKYHLIYVINEQGTIMKVLPEQKITRSYYLENKPSSAVSELFM
ncbi:hypothetical protein SY83_13880 [Paenibacillus swuensis]|uniref:Peptidase M50 domain-containing protein n=2 Tax=Paenibacillus swuensis TaxID=1178515 RepID=A0A172TPD6_9BACL|nr:hypothetical protein SY83_13880 [Paenibacillus swuensis]